MNYLIKINVLALAILSIQAFAADTEKKKTMEEMQQETRNLALQGAAAHGLNKRLRELLKQKADINWVRRIERPGKTPLEQTALTIAALNNRQKTVRYLLAKGADDTQADFHDYLAAVHDRFVGDPADYRPSSEEISQAKLRKTFANYVESLRAPITESTRLDGRTVSLILSKMCQTDEDRNMLCFIDRGDVATVEKYLKRDADPNGHGYKQLSTLSRAGDAMNPKNEYWFLITGHERAMTRSPERLRTQRNMIALLLQYKADPDQVALKPLSTNPLLIATAWFEYDPERMKLLLDHKADYTVADKHPDLGNHEVGRGQLQILRRYAVADAAPEFDQAPKLDGEKTDVADIIAGYAQ